MKVEVTDAAVAYLLERDHALIRIGARDTFECSTMVEYFVQEGEQLDGDESVTVGELTVFYDKKAVEEIGEQVKLDYVESQGLKILAPQGTLAYAQKVRPKSWDPHHLTK
ncbi:Fe-S cluster assembly iron-binding protein IscA [Alkalihalobacillus xiaoxiensis]|uniref:Fe-S cluster assembly iron-binding protein IscA n=1 Tax=Shouchella xiaoxiensis TaxID=766895 RepID=A0ABS2SZ24_9BACI|nr:hypothetical protein [Shouchella xiaoxiensis]MBM7840783.1 Fe-S cluster assembly iron-binding protein IscA [Shouchella xiaoxiensis]